MEERTEREREDALVLESGEPAGRQASKGSGEQAGTRGGRPRRGWNPPETNSICANSAACAAPPIHVRRPPQHPPPHLLPRAPSPPATRCPRYLPPRPRSSRPFPSPTAISHTQAHLLQPKEKSSRLNSEHRRCPCLPRSCQLSCWRPPRPFKVQDFPLQACISGLGADLEQHPECFGVGKEKREHRTPICAMPPSPTPPQPTPASCRAVWCGGSEQFGALVTDSSTIVDSGPASGGQCLVSPCQSPCQRSVATDCWGERSLTARAVTDRCPNAVVDRVPSLACAAQVPDPADFASSKLPCPGLQRREVPPVQHGPQAEDHPCSGCGCCAAAAHLASVLGQRRCHHRH